VRVNELAEQLGVSEPTVRRDINILDHQGLVTRVHGGAVTRRVSDRALMGGAAPQQVKQRALGIVTPSMDYYWPTVVNGVQAAVTANRGQLILRGSSYSLEDDRAQVMRLLETGRVEGLMVAPMPLTRASNDMFGWLDTLPLPVVLMERTVPPEVFAQRLEFVATDQYYSADLGVRHFAALGHTKIGLLTNLGTPHHDVAREGWLQSCRSLGLETRGVVCEDAPRFTTMDRDLLLDGIIERCLRSGTTALIVHADREAIALLQRVQDLGLSIPGDLAIIAHDDEIASLSSPALSAIRPPKRQIGVEAANLLFRRLADQSLPLHHVLLCPELIVRESSGPHKSQ
jgi:DNA-binding LacI/PurR family transcriptional regulator